MSFVEWLGTLGIVVYTTWFARIKWREGHRPAAVAAMLLVLLTLALAAWLTVRGY